MKSIVSGVAVALLLVVSDDAAAIYQCHDENGTVSFQDHPCSATQKAERQIDTPSDKTAAATDAIAVKVPSIGEVLVAVPAGWRHEIANDDGNTPPTLRLTVNNEGGRVDLLVTLMPDPGDLLAKEQAIDTAIVETSQPYVERSVQGKVVIRRLQTGNGIGAYASFTEKVRPPKPEFANVSSGLFNAKGVVCSFTLLADDLASPNHRTALTVLSRGIAAKPRK